MQLSSDSFYPPLSREKTSGPEPQPTCCQPEDYTSYEQEKPLGGCEDGESEVVSYLSLTD